MVGEYGFNNLIYYNEEKQPSKIKIPLDVLKQKIKNKIKEVDEPKIEEVDSTDQNTLLNKCDEFINKNNFMKKKEINIIITILVFIYKGLKIFML